VFGRFVISGVPKIGDIGATSEIIRFPA